MEATIRLYRTPTQQLATRPKYWKEFCSLVFFCPSLRVFSSLCVWKIFYDSIFRYKFSSIKRLARTTTTWRDRVRLHHRSKHILLLPQHTVEKKEREKKKRFGILSYVFDSAARFFPIFILIYTRSESFTIFILGPLGMRVMCVRMRVVGWNVECGKMNPSAQHFCIFWCKCVAWRICRASRATENGWRYVIFSGNAIFT